MGVLSKGFFFVVLVFYLSLGFFFKNRCKFSLSKFVITVGQAEPKSSLSNGLFLAKKQFEFLGWLWQQAARSSLICHSFSSLHHFSVKSCLSFLFKIPCPLTHLVKDSETRWGMHFDWGFTIDRIFCQCPLSPRKSCLWISVSCLISDNLWFTLPSLLSIDSGGFTLYFFLLSSQKTVCTNIQVLSSQA